MPLTNIPMTMLEGVLKKQWYRTRWQIEVYHKVLESGCKIEGCRLEDGSRLIRYVTLTSVIAWRLHWLAYVSRVVPEQSCRLVLDKHERQALYIKPNRTKHLPAKVPSIYQVVRRIAQLGGFSGRKNDGEPGIVVIWRGWQRLHDTAENFLLFNSNTYG